MHLGTIAEIWRYPVKSLGGEALAEAVIAGEGLAGDRQWAVYDPSAPVIRSAKQWPQLLDLRARFLREPGAEDRGDAVAPVCLMDAGGERCDSDDAAACAAWLSARVGRAVELRPRASTAAEDFYALPAARTDAAIAGELGLEAGEPLPEFNPADGDVMAQLAEHATPPGFLYDAYPLHLLTRDSLAFLAGHGGESADARRFRPNLLLESASPAPALTENDWVGHRLAVGEVILRIHSRTLRCSMPARPQAGFGLPPAPALARALARHAERHLGINARVLRPGRVRTGDPVRLLAD